MAKRKDGLYDPQASTWVKIKNRGYSQAVGRHDYFTKRAGRVTNERMVGRRIKTAPAKAERETLGAPARRLRPSAWARPIAPIEALTDTHRPFPRYYTRYCSHAAV